MKIYEQLGIRLTHHLGANTLDVEVETPNGPGIKTRSAEHVRNAGVRGRTFSIIREKNYTIATDLPIETDWKLTRDIAERESVDATAIRTWARGQGLDVATRGRLPFSVIQAWRLANK